jgi:SAM-dependent methyltransferase
MNEPWPLPVDFPAYLEAKIEVDDRSLHPRLLQGVCERLGREPGLRVLDVGTGTGAMLRRLLARVPEWRAELAGLDPDPGSLEVAARRLRVELRRQGRRVEVERAPGRLELTCAPGEAGGTGGEFRVRLLRGGLLDEETALRLRPRSFDLVTAHAFLDLLPTELALGAIHRLLRVGGWLYATINYDGLTALLPPDEEPELEARLLERYELSMEARRVGGRPTAGRWSGRRLCRHLPECGYAIRDVAASDWMIFPGPRGHSRSRRVFLRTLLTFMAGEGLAAGLDPEGLRRWYARRLEAVERGKLALMTHQLDVLAERTG